MTKKVCVIGASSLVGRQVFQTLRSTSACGGMEVLGTYFSSEIPECECLDITDAEAVRPYLATNEPDEVVLVAGTKDVRACEADESLAMTLNLDPVETLCNAIVESDLPTRLLYISSDYVFDAKQGNYSVDSPVNPTTVYGRSKVLAEDRVLRGDIPGCVIRTAAVMGCSGGFLSWLIDALETPETVELFGNSFFSPTPVQMLADCITEILCTEMSERQRIYHAVGPERMSRFDFGCLIRDLLQESGAPVAAELLKGGKGLGSDLSLVPNVTPYSVGTERLDFRDYLRVELSSCIRN